MTAQKIPQPTLIGVHLEIQTQSDPQPLMRAFGQGVFTFRIRRGKERRRIRLDLAVDVKDADAVILRFCSDP